MGRVERGILAQRSYKICVIFEKIILCLQFFVYALSVLFTYLGGFFLLQSGEKRPNIQWYRISAADTTHTTVMHPQIKLGSNLNLSRSLEDLKIYSDYMTQFSACAALKIASISASGCIERWRMETFFWWRKRLFSVPRSLRIIWSPRAMFGYGIFEVNGHFTLSLAQEMFTHYVGTILENNI